MLPRLPAVDLARREVLLSRPNSLLLWMTESCAARPGRPRSGQSDRCDRTERSGGRYILRRRKGPVLLPPPRPTEDRRAGVLLQQAVQPAQLEGRRPEGVEDRTLGRALPSASG
jgi:hypothetical protein